jgi:hypothetical protein
MSPEDGGFDLLLTLLTGAERETLATLGVRPLLDRGTGMALVGVALASVACWRRLASLPEGRPSFGGGNDLKVDFDLVSVRSESDGLLRKGQKSLTMDSLGVRKRDVM